MLNQTDFGTLTGFGTLIAIIGFIVLIGTGVADGQIYGTVQYPPLSIGEGAQPPPPAKMVPHQISPRPVEFGVSGSSLPPLKPHYRIQPNADRLTRQPAPLDGASRLSHPRPAAEVTKVSPGSAGELELSTARNLAQRRHVDDPEEEMPYRISYIDTSVIDRRATDGWRATPATSTTSIVREARRPQRLDTVPRLRTRLLCREAGQPNDVKRRSLEVHGDATLWPKSSRWVGRARDKIVPIAAVY